MNGARIHILATTSASIAIGGLFVASGVLKLFDPARFATDIGHYRLVSPLIAASAAVYLPWLEISLGVGLAWPRLRAAARLVALSLLVVFSLALLSAILRGIDLRCGCFGDGGMSAGWALGRNLGLIALLLIARPRDAQ